MTDYNVIAEVDATPTEKRSEAWMNALASYHPAVGRTSRNRSELIITIPATSLEQAISTGLAIMLRTAGQIERLEVLTSAEYERRLEDIGMPDMVGATQAAEIIGISRQRVQQMVAIGQIPSMKVGDALVMPRRNVEAIAAARKAGKTVDG